MDEEKIDKRTVLLVTTLGAFLTPFMGSSINIALPSIGKEFSMNAVTLSWIGTAYLLATAVFLVPMGRAADIYGRKKFFLIGMFVYTLSTALCCVSGSAGLLIGARVLQGFGAAMIFGTSTAILTSAYPAQERGKVLGINVASVYLGLSAGPFLGGVLTQQLGWRSIFWITTFLGVLLIGLILWHLRTEWAEARGERYDLTGSILYSLTLGAGMAGVPNLHHLSGIVLVALSATGLVAFAYQEKRQKYPILDVGVFRRNTVFVFSNLAALIHYCATFAISFLLSLYLQHIKGLTPQNAGLILVVQPVMMVLCSPVAGRLSDRIEPRIVSSVGMGITTLGLILMSFLGTESRLVYLTGVLALIGLGFGFFSSPNTNAVMSSVDRRYYGVASGVLGTMRLTGQTFSMGIMTFILAMYMGQKTFTTVDPALFLQSMRIGFVLFSVLCLVGTLASLARGKVRTGQK